MNKSSNMIISNKKVTAQINQNDEMKNGMVMTHYEDNINMYNKPPENIISLHEFNKIALERLQVLKKIEFMYDSNDNDVKIKDTVFKMTKDHRMAVQPKFITSSSGSMASTLTQDERLEFKHNDNVSHFICRLAYCRNEELRKWFLTQETRLFSIRLKDLNPLTVKQLLESKCGITYEQVQPEDGDWKSFESEITFKAGGKPQEVQASFYVRVPFKEACALVGRRGVFLHMGIVYVPLTQLFQIATSQFRMRLSAELNKAFKYLPGVMKDERLGQMLINLSNHNAIDFNLYEAKAPTDADKICLKDLDFYSRKSFPPCMKSIFTVVRNKHHLKHYGRLQLGLFFKGIGLTLDEAYTFWKQEFTKKMDSDKFEKQYGYNIRHTFGQEGKKADYKPWSCSTVLAQTTPGPDEFHGCPFKTFSEDPLKQLLSSYGIKNEEMKVVIDKRRENLHQVACLRLFEAVHPGSVTENVGNHPIGFLNSSIQYNKDVEKNKLKKGGSVPSEGGLTQQNAGNTQSNMSDITAGEGAKDIEMN